MVARTANQNSLNIIYRYIGVRYITMPKPPVLTSLRTEVVGYQGKATQAAVQTPRGRTQGRTASINTT